jgi:hypothetical protein
VKSHLLISQNSFEEGQTTMANRKGTRRQTIVHTILQRKSHYKLFVNPIAQSEYAVSPPQVAPLMLLSLTNSE